MLRSVMLSERSSLKFDESLRRCSGGEEWRRSEPRFTEESLGYVVDAREKLFVEANCAVRPISAESTHMDELPGLLGLS